MSLARGQNPRHKTLCRQPANRNQPREIGLSRLYSTIDTGHERRKYRETTSIPSSFFSIHPSIRPSILVPFPHLPPPLLSCLSPPNLPSFSILDSSVQPDPLDPFSAVSSCVRLEDTSLHFLHSRWSIWSHRSIDFRANLQVGNPFSSNFYSLLNFVLNRNGSNERWETRGGIFSYLSRILSFKGFETVDRLFLSSCSWERRGYRSLVMYHRLWDLWGLYHRVEFTKDDLRTWWIVEIYIHWRSSAVTHDRVYRAIYNDLKRKGKETEKWNLRKEEIWNNG